MKEFVEEYGGVVLLSVMGLSVIAGMWAVVQLISAIV